MSVKDNFVTFVELDSYKKVITNEIEAANDQFRIDMQKNLDDAIMKE
jgi:hypothetical protein